MLTVSSNFGAYPQAYLQLLQSSLLLHLPHFGHSQLPLNVCHREDGGLPSMFLKTLDGLCTQVDLEIDSEADSAAQADVQNPASGLSVRTGHSRRDIPPAAHGAEADVMEADAGGAAAAETSSEETGEEGGGARNGGKRKRLEGRRAGAGGGRSRGPAAQPNGIPSAKGAHSPALPPRT